MMKAEKYIKRVKLDDETLQTLLSENHFYLLLILMNNLQLNEALLIDYKMIPKSGEQRKLNIKTTPEVQRQAKEVYMKL